VAANFSEKGLARFGWQSPRFYQAADRRGCHRIQHRGPAIGGRVGRKGLAGCLGQLIGHLGRKPEAGIGWAG
jgi:hypothetical protein